MCPDREFFHFSVIVIKIFVRHSGNIDEDLKDLSTLGILVIVLTGFTVLLDRSSE